MPSTHVGRSAGSTLASSLYVRITLFLPESGLYAADGCTTRLTVYGTAYERRRQQETGPRVPRSLRAGPLRRRSRAAGARFALVAAGTPAGISCRRLGRQGDGGAPACGQSAAAAARPGDHRRRD